MCLAEICGAALVVTVKSSGATSISIKKSIKDRSRGHSLVFHVMLKFLLSMGIAFPGGGVFWDYNFDHVKKWTGYVNRMSTNASQLSPRSQSPLRDLWYLKLLGIAWCVMPPQVLPLVFRLNPGTYIGTLNTVVKPFLVTKFTGPSLSACGDIRS